MKYARSRTSKHIVTYGGLCVPLTDKKLFRKAYSVLDHHS